ncbi:RNA polymerase II transcription factor SIII subunit A-domain-containing protein [Crepidotus variabilis]|uniref:RNA polymerase II transcription factor SIII subunit A-domain-containing protein n=1 Tax=Crepidotus variabilis TaxID=179855 RepID=A0A9P6JTA9_9AGAR|nr:RNA polymerase II transcription factor SIII subunit A-domain-containing protein [Crepidotus variabilis]
MLFAILGRIFPCPGPPSMSKRCLASSPHHNVHQQHYSSPVHEHLHSLLHYAMDSENEPQHCRIPTLVQLCQKAAIANVDAIQSLGDISYPLVKPILGRCTTEQLLRFEQLSPHLEKDTSEIWRDLCFQKYHFQATERYSPEGRLQGSDSWRSRYFVLKELEAKRIEEIGSRIRTQRLEADERKKEKEVKFTDRVPPAKRPRTGGWNTISQPKSLFQKTRSEASKIQRTVNTRLLPPMPTAKTYRAFPKNSDPVLPSVESSGRVSVNTVTVHRRSSVKSSSPSLASQRGLMSVHDISASKPSSLPSAQKTIVSRPASSSYLSSLSSSSLHPASTAATGADLVNPSPRLKFPVKRDPMAALFVPKRRQIGRQPV